MPSITSSLSRGAGLLSAALIAVGLSSAPAKQASAQACTHQSVIVACPIGEVPGSNSLGFDANGNAFYANGATVPPDYNVQASNTETAQGLFNVSNDFADKQGSFGIGSGPNTARGNSS